MKEKLKKLSPHISAFLIILIATALIESAMGRIWICKCGYISLWYGNTNGSGNSQHITDWYSFSHFIHGMLFYGLLHVFAKKLPMRTRFIIAVLMEAVWEIFENSSYTINRYRTATAALDYYGDSILNSVVDIITCSLGFLLTRKISAKLSVVLIIVLELFALYFVRDNLTLNIIMLIHPVEAIKVWQLGGM
jgi:hypothetical protein